MRNLLRFSAPSVLGVCAAAVLASLAETIWHTESVGDAFAAAGFLLVFALPIGVACSLLGRVLAIAWDWRSFGFAPGEGESDSARTSAWILFLLVAALVLAIGTHQGVTLLFANTRMNSTVLFGAPVVVFFVSLVLLAISLPLVDQFERLVLHRNGKRLAAGKQAMLTPPRVLLAIVSLGSVASVAIWFLIVSPRLGHLDLSFVGHLLLFAFGVALLPLLWQRAGGSKGGRVAVVLVVSAATCAGLLLAAWLRYERPYKMLEVWGETKLAGWAIDTLYDVQSVRVDLTVEGIEPTVLPELADRQQPNVVIITIDTVRADHTPLHGGKAKMPTLALLGERAAVFERAYSPGNVTRRSIPTIATGLSPRRVRGRVAGWALRMDPRHIVLAERFRAGGYDTAGFFCCNSFFGRTHRLGLINGINHIEVNHAGKVLAQRSANWLQRRGKTDTPLFLWAHFLEPHNWLKNHKAKPGARSKSERYDKSLEATDEFLKIMMDEIRRQLGDNTIVVITADHGEGLGDHGVPHHAGSLYNSEIRVPLVIAGPGIEPARIEQSIGLVDLGPTLMELAGFEPPGMPQMDGLSVAPTLLGQQEDKLGIGEAYAVIMADRSVAASQAAVMSGRYKLIEGPNKKYELYDLDDDPSEARDIKAHLPKVFASMKARLARRRKLDRISPF